MRENRGKEGEGLLPFPFSPFLSLALTFTLNLIGNACCDGQDQGKPATKSGSLLIKRGFWFKSYTVFHKISMLNVSTPFWIIIIHLFSG